jgi:hypothetical protein
LDWTPTLLAASPPTRIREGKTCSCDTLLFFLSANPFFFFFCKGQRPIILLMPPPLFGRVRLFVLLWEEDFVSLSFFVGKIIANFDI